MEKGVLSIISVVLWTMVHTSCTVKEDRTPCPCELSVNVEAAVPSGTAFDPLDASLLYISLYGEDSELLNRECFDRHTMDDTLDFKVKKGYVYLVAFVGINNSHLEGNTIVIPKGCESDEIYLSSEMVDCLVEKAGTKLDLKKEFSKVTLREIVVDGGKEYLSNFTLAAISSSSGLDIFSARATKGEYYYKIPRNSDGSYSFKIPRQRDKSLSIKLIEGDGSEYGTIPLGDVLDKYGYDWDAASLEDVNIGINVPETGFEVEIEKWKESEDYTELL